MKKYFFFVVAIFRSVNEGKTCIIMYAVKLESLAGIELAVW